MTKEKAFEPVLKFSLHGKGLGAAGATRHYWIGASGRNPIALYIKPMGRFRFVFYRTYRSTGDAARAAEAMETKTAAEQERKNIVSTQGSTTPNSRAD